MNSNNINHLENNIRQLLEELRLPLQSALRKIDEELKNISHLSQKKSSPQAHKEDIYVAVASEKKIKADQLTVIHNRNYADFDIVLNLPLPELQVRQDPENRSPLHICSPEGVGPFRMKLLLYMLEHPLAPICSNTIQQVYGPNITVEPSALAKTIHKLRTILQPGQGRGSYIINQMGCGKFLDKSGYFYQMNHQWQYLVIK